MAHSPAARYPTHGDSEDTYLQADAAQLAAVASTEALQFSLLQDPRPAVRSSLAQSEHLLAAVQHKLAHDFDPQVRCSLARNPALTEEAALILSQDPLPTVRYALAGTFHLAVLDVLSQDPHADVLCSLASNTHLPTHLQIRLAARRVDYRVPVILMANPALSLTADFPVPFCLAWAIDFLEDTLADLGVSAEWHTVAENWTGSISELASAVVLLTPSHPQD